MLKLLIQSILNKFKPATKVVVKKPAVKRVAVKKPATKVVVKKPVKKVK